MLPEGIIINLFSRFSLSVGALLAAGIPTLASASAAQTRVAVSAPNAQQLVASLSKEHPEVALIGLHTPVPGGGPDAIIACTDTAKVGNASSPADLALEGKGLMTIAALPKRHVWEAAMSLSDAQGRPPGMMVGMIKLDRATDEADALNQVIQLRSEIQSRIKSQSWLFASE